MWKRKEKKMPEKWNGEDEKRIKQERIKWNGTEKNCSYIYIYVELTEPKHVEWMWHFVLDCVGICWHRTNGIKMTRENQMTKDVVFVVYLCDWYSIQQHDDDDDNSLMVEKKNRTNDCFSNWIPLSQFTLSFPNSRSSFPDTMNSSINNMMKACINDAKANMLQYRCKKLACVCLLPFDHNLA